MKTISIAALALCGWLTCGLATPTLAQQGLFGEAEVAITSAQQATAAADAKAQQALDGTTVLANTQTAIEQRVTDLEARVASLEAALTTLQNSPATWPTHGIFYMNALPQGGGNACTMDLAAGTVDCAPDVSDLEGDATDVAISCTSGDHDGTTYTATEAGAHTCHFMASDPRWDYATHNSTVTITVNP